MGFYTGMKFVRPTPPPRVTGQDLAAFVREIVGCGVVEDDGMMNVAIKGGERIDADARGTIEEVPTELPGVLKLRSIRWDVEVDCGSHAELIATLERFQGTVYRAFISLGSDALDLSKHVAREEEGENGGRFCPDCWSIEIGPAFGSLLSGDTRMQVGWMAVGFSGYGYLYPWTFPELVAHVEKLSGIRRVVEVCRKRWPMPSEPVNAAVMEMRKGMGEMWPYGRLDIPWDWMWSVSETG